MLDHSPIKFRIPRFLFVFAFTLAFTPLKISQAIPPFPKVTRPTQLLLKRVLRTNQLAEDKAFLQILRGEDFLESVRKIDQAWTQRTITSQIAARELDSLVSLEIEALIRKRTLSRTGFGKEIIPESHNPLNSPSKMRSPSNSYSLARDWLRAQSAEQPLSWQTTVPVENLIPIYGIPTPQDTEVITLGKTPPPAYFLRENSLHLPLTSETRPFISELSTRREVWRGENFESWQLLYPNKEHYPTLLQIMTPADSLREFEFSLWLKQRTLESGGPLGVDILFADSALQLRSPKGRLSFVLRDTTAFEALSEFDRSPVLYRSLKYPSSHLWSIEIAELLGRARAELLLHHGIWIRRFDPNDWIIQVDALNGMPTGKLILSQLKEIQFFRPFFDRIDMAMPENGGLTWIENYSKGIEDAPLFDLESFKLNTILPQGPSDSLTAKTLAKMKERGIRDQAMDAFRSELSLQLRIEIPEDLQSLKELLQSEVIENEWRTLVEIHQMR